jgi:hypothetical protein
MALVDSIETKVRLTVPGTSDHWSSELIQSFVHAADCLIKEEAESSWTTQEIDLLSEASYYPYSEQTIAIRFIDMATDGTNFDDGALEPIGYDDLDAGGAKWVDDRGSQPDYYVMLGTPGVPDSRVMIYRKISGVTTEKIRLWVLKCIPDNDATFEAETVPEVIEDRVYLPLVLALLYADNDNNAFTRYMDEYSQNIVLVKDYYRSKYTESLGAKQ